MKSKVSQFLFNHLIFSFDEFVCAMNNPPSTCRAMIAQHVKRENIIPIKRGLYAAVPAGAQAAQYPVDPYLIVNACAQDAVIAYHSALQFHGYAHSAHFDYVFLSERHIRPFQFRQDRFLAHSYPSSLAILKRQPLVESIDYHGYDIKVTDITRTMVDVLDRVNLSGGLEEVWNSLGLIDAVNVDHAITYALDLKNKTTNSKLGFYLSWRKEAWSVNDEQLERLREGLPSSPHYMDRTHRKNGVLVKEWQLIVPQELVGDRWGEQLTIGEQ